MKTRRRDQDALGIELHRDIAVARSDKSLVIQAAADVDEVLPGHRLGDRRDTRLGFARDMHAARRTLPAARCKAAAQADQIVTGKTALA
jgi:hypothetical protein